MDQIHKHSTPETTLLPLLNPLLPYSLPLYRRIQFGQRGSVHAYTLASVAPNDTNSTDHKKEHGKRDASDCLAAAYIDRSARPETEAFIFLSWDSPSHNPNTPCQCSSLLISLLHRVSELPYAPLSDGAKADALSAVQHTDAATASRYHTHASASAAAFLSHLDDPDLLKLGTLHARSVRELKAHGCIRLGLPGADFPYVKYLFPQKSSAAEGPSAGETDGHDDDGELLSHRGLRWGALRDEDLALVRSRTAIPRTNRTLRSLPAAALFPAVASPNAATAPVAWAFLGADGSLCSLHVEPKYRGYGLAKALVRKLFRDGFKSFGDELGRLAHADVAANNLPSSAVCLSLGASKGWEVYWVRASLSSVRSATPELKVDSGNV
ncbi:hypothetical protein IWZ03DRAFT_392357 [Phyllosticta citriasiana]|uniref:GCN5-related N-acetyltransferase Rv2170-like domain-containing protein n=1 Tax=Phyllosticta citriasiana TaxID=595635 RepID=A0ABR1KVJ1_9PEZI